MASPEDNQANVVEKKDNNKEYNFRMLEQRLLQETEARIAAEKKAQEALQKSHVVDDDDDGEPYVDQKRLNKKFNSFEKTMEERIEKKAEQIARNLVQNEKKDNWIKNNPDFYDTLQRHAESFHKLDPELAETILTMPDTFERQKLVYKNIKALGIDKPKETIQQKVDSRNNAGFYQPSGMGAAPYNNQSDFSLKGQMESYKKMQELKERFGG